MSMGCRKQAGRTPELGGWKLRSLSATSHAAVEENPPSVPFLQRFEPDVIIALGGGSPMDAAKVCGLLQGWGTTGGERSGSGLLQPLIESFAPVAALLEVRNVTAACRRCTGVV